VVVSRSAAQSVLHHGVQSVAQGTSLSGTLLYSQRTPGSFAPRRVPGCSLWLLVALSVCEGSAKRHLRRRLSSPGTIGYYSLSSAIAVTALVQLCRRQYRRRPRRLGRRPRPRRPSAVRTRRFPCGSPAQRTRPTAAAGAVEAVTFETASGAPWMWNCTSCAPDGCAITAPSNAGSASSASTPSILVGTVPAALGDLWCIGRIKSMCVRSRRAFLAAHRRCQCAFVQQPERAKPHRPVARRHHAAAHPLIDVRPRRLSIKSRTLCS
jgi:hypothetical protein